MRRPRSLSVTLACAGLAALLGFPLASPVGSAGPEWPDLIATAGTVARDAGGRDWAYLRWGAENDAVLDPFRLEVAVKPGPPESPAAFATGTVITAAEDPASASRALASAEALGQSGPALDSALAALAPHLGVPAGSTVADRLAGLVRARADPGVRPVLAPLMAAHPAVALALGRAWAGPIPVGPSTLEVRAILAGGPSRVIGRVTVAAGAPVPAPAPGPVVEVPETGASGDLNLRLRWVSPPALRRRLTLVQGFEVWRLAADAARGEGWDAAPPSLAGLMAMAEAGRAVRITSSPVLPQRHHDALSVTDFAADSSAFVTDDHGRDEPGGTPFEDGSEWAYVVTTLDLLGRPGAPSPVGFARACRRLGPPPPRDLTIENVADWTAADGARQFLRLQGRADRADPRDRWDRLEVFRGTNLAEIQAPGSPGSLVPVAELMAGPDPAVAWTDRSLVPESAWMGRTWWYAVRAIRDGPCGPIPGPLSAPVLGGLRQHASPDAPTGSLSVNCPRPLVQRIREYREEEPARPGFLQYRLEALRRDGGIEWAEFRVTDASGATVLESEREAFPADADRVSVRVDVPSGTLRPRLECRVGTGEGLESGWVGQEPAWNGDLWVMAFEASEVGTLDLDPADPLSAPALEGPHELVLLQAGADGGLVLRAPPVSGGEILVQAREPGGDWGTLDTAEAADGTVTVAESRLREGADPGGWAFRGYFIRGRGVGGQDPGLPCSHLARPGGGDRIRPVSIRLSLPERGRQYRLYRQTDGGPLTLIAQGTAPAFAPQVPPSARRIVRHDDVLPDASAELCYFGQALDEHGNASPLAPLGCVSVRPRAIPVPVLARPLAAGQAGTPEVVLRWYCPPAGVHQFEVTLAPRSGTNRAETVIGTRTLRVALEVPWVRSPREAQVEARRRFLSRDRILTAAVGGPELGNGPQFEARFRVEEGTDYDVAVTALGRPAGVLQPRSKPSESRVFQWRPPEAGPEEGDVPWPARPLPPVTPFHPALRLVWLNATNLVWPTHLADGAPGLILGPLPIANASLEGPFYPLGKARVGEAGGFDPNRAVVVEDGAFRGPVASKLLPAVLYRQQVTNDTYPVVSGDLIQVSSLIREIQWGEIPLRDGPIVVLTDPFAAVVRSPVELQMGGLEGRDARRRLCLLDLHPVVGGARYRYSLVRFGGHGEPVATVPVGELEVP